MFIFYRAQEHLAQYTGRQLFSMSKGTLERMFGTDEGGRLYSQLLVQKNLSGVCFMILLVRDVYFVSFHCMFSIIIYIK